MTEETTKEASKGESAGGETGRFGKAREFVDEQYAKASGAVRDGYNSMREKVEDVDMDEVIDHVRSYVRSNPGKALLISVGVGFVIGLLLRRDDGE